MEEVTAVSDSDNSIVVMGWEREAVNVWNVLKVYESRPLPKKLLESLEDPLPTSTTGFIIPRQALDVESIDRTWYRKKFKVLRCIHHKQFKIKG